MSKHLLPDSMDGELAIEEVKPKLKQPRRYKVFILNDDYTPMDFVVEILKYFFHMDEEKATLVMLKVHHEGKGLCGVYTRDIAETKVMQVNDFSRANEHPLQCSMEPE